MAKERHFTVTTVERAKTSAKEARAARMKAKSAQAEARANSQKPLPTKIILMSVGAGQD
jgi:hypothetical protein